MIKQYKSLFGNMYKLLKYISLPSISLVIISIFIFISIFAYYIIPQNTSNSNEIELSLANKPPGFQVNYLFIKKNIVNKSSFLNKLFFGEILKYKKIPIEYYKLKNDSIFYLDYGSNNITNNVKKISLNQILKLNEDIVCKEKFLLGTDKYGRDLMSRIILGARLSLSVGFFSVIVSLIIGLFFGLIAGYYGGKIDYIIQWLINVVWSIPTLLLVISISFVLGKGFWQLFLAIGLTMWVEVARVTRGEVLKINSMQFITSAKSLGYNDYRIIIKHILPNVINPLIIISTANFATAILLESGLSFLGLGIQPPIPSWGSIIKNHYLYILIDNPFCAIFPGICIVLIVLSFMSLGNYMRDILDVKIK